MTSRNYAFQTLQLPEDGGRTLKAYVMWIKSHHVLWSAFPTVNQSVYYKKVQMLGVQRFWTSTWMDRFHTACSLGESTAEINDCWASLLLHHLDNIWPQLDTLSDSSFENLTSIHRLTNRIKGAKLHGVGLATKCSNPDKLEGFVDLYEDIGATEDLTKWLVKTFLPQNPRK